MKVLNLLIPYLLLFCISGCSQDEEVAFQEISFLSLDSLEITADLYEADTESSTYIILFHQANFSRGSYRSIAPKLNGMGYNCLAVDQRSGHKAEGVVNETCKRAISADKGIKFADAIQDVEAAYLYVKNELKAEKIIIWGSSYSASIVLYMGAKYPNDIDAILSFSPGEYFEIEDQSIESFADKIACPVFITSAKNEKDSWFGIYEKISSEKSFYLPEKGGAHGSKALWPNKKDSEGYWKAVKVFLESLDS